MLRREEQAGRVSGRLVTDVPDSLTIAAHELKTPLATMRQLSLELAHSVDEIEIERIARQIQLTAERSLRLTSDLTYSSRMQPALFPLEPLSARRILTDVVNELAPLYAAYDRQLVLRLPKRMPNIISHPDLLKRILLNFCDNALHYADTDNKVVVEGGVLVKGDTVRLGVIDGGPMTVRRVRRPRIDYGRPAGSGLGLAIADTFAEVIQASTGVTKKQNGAHYYIDVPISKQLSLI